MDEKKQLSRDLFKKISSIVNNLIGFSDLQKVWTCLYLSDIEFSKSVYSSLALTKTLKTFNEQYSRILYSNIITKIVGFVTNENFYKTPFPNDLLVVDTDQSTYVLNNYLKNVKSALDNYLNGDEEFYFIYNKDSLEALFATLTTGLQSFKRFYRADALNSFITYKHLESIIRETANDRNNYIDGLDRSILLNNVNIDSPVSSDDIPQGTTWKQLYIDFRDICNNLISANELQFYIRNLIYNSVNRAIISQESQYNQIIQFGVNYELEAKSVLNDGRQLNKILITAKINDNELYTNNVYDLDKIKTKFLNRSIFYYNYTNFNAEPRTSFLTRSKIIGVELDNTKINLTLSPFNGFNDRVKSVSFPLNDEGIFFEKDFSTLNSTNQNDPPMTFNISDRNLFKLTVLSGTTSINVINFRLPDSAFKTNYITFPNATSDPSKFWIVSEKTVTNEKTIEIPWQNLTLYKKDLVNNKLELFTTIVTYTNPNRYPNKNIISFLDQSIFSTNRFDDYPSYGDFFTKWNITTSESTNIFFKENFKTFTVEKTDLDLFSFKINYSDGSSDIFPYKLNNSSFINNLIRNGLLTTGDDVTSNPLLNWNIFYDNPNYNNGLIFFEKTFESTSIDKDDSNLFSLEITSGGQIIQTINYSFPKSIITDNILIENLSDESIASGVNINSRWNTFYDNPIQNVISGSYDINNITFDKSDLNLFSVVITRNDFSVSGTDSFKLNDSFFETNVLLDQLKDEANVSGSNPNLYWGVYYDNPIQEVISGLYDFNDIIFNKNHLELFSIEITKTSQFNNDLEIVSGTETFKLNDSFFESNVLLDQLKDEANVSGTNPNLYWGVYYDNPIQEVISGLYDFNNVTFNKNNSDLFTIKVTKTSQFNNDLETVSGTETFKLSDVIFNSNRFPESSIASGNNSLINWEIYHDGSSPIDGLGSFNNTTADITLSKDDVNFSSVFLIEKSNTCVSGAGVSTQFNISNYQYYEFEKNQNFNLIFDYEILTPNLNVNDISFKIVEFYSSSGVDLFNEIASFTLSSGSVSQGQYYNANFNFNTTESSIYRFLIHFNNYDETNISLKIKNLYVGRFNQIESFKTYNNSLEFVNDFYISNPNLPSTFFFYLTQLNNKLRFTSLAFTEFINIYKMEFIDVNSSLNFLFEDNNYIKNQTIYNPRINFKKDPIDYKTVLTKNYSYNSGGGVMTNFLLTPNLRNSELNLNFEYEILSNDFNINDISFEVYEYTNVTGAGVISIVSGTEIVTGSSITLGIEFLNLIDSFTFTSGLTNQNQTYSVDFSFNSTNSEIYALKIDFKEQNTKNIQLKLNDFYIGTDNFNETTKTYNNPSQFVNDFYISNPNLPPTFFFYLTQLNNKLRFTSLAFTEFNNIYKMRFFNINPVLSFLFEDNDYIKDSIIYNPRITFKKDPIDYKTILTKNYSSNSGGGITTNFLLPSKFRNSELKINFESEIVSDYFDVNDINIEIHEYVNISGSEVLNLIDFFTLASGTTNQNFSFNSTNSEIYAFRIDFKGQNTKNIQLKLNDFYIGTDNFNETTKTYDDPSQFVNDFYISNPNIPLTYFFYLSDLENKLRFTSLAFTEFNNIYKIEFTNINPVLSFLFEDNNYMKDGIIYNPRFYFKKDLSDYKTFLFKNYSSNLGGGINTEFLIDNNQKNKPLKLEFNYQILSDDFDVDDVSFKIIENYTASGTNESNEIASFNLPIGSIAKNELYLASFEFNSTNSSIYKIEVSFENLIPKTTQLKLSNFYVGEFSLNRNEKTYELASDFVSDFNTNNVSSSFFNLSSSPNNKINFTTTIFNDNPNISKLEFTNVNSRISWLFSNNFVINDFEINNPNISFYRDSDKKTILLKKYSNILKGGVSTDFIISEFDREQKINLQFNYIIISSDFSSNDITFEIVTFDDNNQERIINSFNLTDVTPNQEKFANFNFISSFNDSRYRLKIKFTNETFKELKIKVSNFYVGKYSLNQNNKTYYRPQEFINDFIKSNEIPNSYLFYLNEINDNGFYEMSFFSNLFNQYVNIDKIEFIDINNKLNWFFNSNSIFNSNSNSEISNPQISFSKDKNGGYILHKRDSKTLGGSIFTDFIISDFEKNNSNFKLNFDYELPSNFNENDIKISIRKINSNEQLDDFIIQDIKLNINNTKFERIFRTSTNNKYRLFISFSNESIKDIKIKLNNFYVGRYSLLQDEREYSDINEFLYDFNLINKISKSGNYYFDKDKSNSKLIFYNNFFEDNNVVNIRFDKINSSLNWFFTNNESQSNLIINNSTLSFTRNNSNEFLLYKNKFNLLNSTIHHLFIISNEDKLSNLKINFNYKIISQNFSKSFISIEIKSIEQNNQEKTLKTFELSSVDPNVELSFNGDFTTNSSTNYKLVLKINDNTSEIIQMTFKNFYTGKNVFNQNVVTFNNPKDFIKNIISSDEFNNFKGFTISYNSTDINQETNQDLVNTVSYKMSFNSEPYYVGERYSFNFSEVHPKLKWFFYDSEDEKEKTYSGKNFIQYVDSGLEVKYYDLFINLSKAVFSILNSYALSRLIVPEAFDEENNIFPAGTNIPFNYKQYYSELVDDLTIDFKEKFVQDPRSNFTKVVQNRDFPTGPNWKKASVSDALGLKDLSKIRSVLDTVKTALKKIKSILDAIKRFLEILEELIELASDIIGALLDTVITQLEKIVDNIGSTGLYFLPIIEYYSISSNKDWWINKYNYKDTAFEEFVNSPYPGQSNVSITNQFTETMRQLRKTNDAILGESLSLDQENLGKENKFFTGWKAGIPWLPFRSTTYDEFIEVIIDALLDPEDLPELGLRAVAGEKKDEKKNKKNELALFSNDSKDKKSNKFPAGKNIIRPGAPKWSAGSQSKVIVFAVNFPAPEDIIYGLSGGWELFLTSIYPVLKSINFINQSLITDDNNKTIKQYNENAKKYNERIKTENDNIIEDIKKLKDEIKEILDPIEKKISQKKKEFKEKLKDRNDYIKFQQGQEVTVEEKEDIEKEIKGFERELKEIDKQHSKLRQEYTKADTSKDGLSKRKEIKKLKESLISMSTYGFSETIEGWVESIEQQLNINDILKEIDIEEPKPEVSKSLGEIAGETAYNIYESTLKPTIDTVGDIYEDPYRLIDSASATRKNIFSGTRGTYPDFYGVTLGSLFPGVYSFLKGLLKEARNLNEEETDSTLSEEFKELIEPIENFIKKIEKIIRRIDAFLDLIDAILNISVSYLVIDSKNGVEDIIQQLRNAEGFPLEEKRQVIFGGMIGAGMFDPNSTDFNLSGYFKESMAEFNESAGEMFDELNLSNEEKGIGFLSKIFKTPKVDNPTGVDSIGGA